LFAGCGAGTDDTGADGARDAAPADAGARDAASPADAPLDLAPPPDPCASATLGNGGYCGVALTGGDPAALYDCENGKTASKTICPMGCHSSPPKMNDYCNASDLNHLPWPCNVTFTTTQGNNQGDHVGVQQFAFDFGLTRHTPVRPIRTGTVTLSANVVSQGQACYDGCSDPNTFTNCCNACINTSNHVNIQHSDGTVSTYWHLDVATATVGAVVQPTDIIGYSGTSGCSTGPHVHMQLMGNCPKGYCQSVPLSFAECGVPVTGQKVTSQNCP
jgi:murein DD-endopeptidase MepM/ murein hydrolase activator NlpD